MKEMWDKRYAVDQFVYGKEPNQFFKDSLEKLNITGKVLFPAEGEGRNAVYAAKQGLSVDAFDISAEGQQKALRYADAEGVNLNYQVGALNELSYTSESFDAVALVFAHFPPPLREGIHSKLSAFVKPGGLLILEAFSVGNLPYREKNPSVGGPDKATLLYTAEMIENDFAGFEIIKLEEKEIELKEGELHNGIAKVIRFVGRKLK